MRTIGVIALCLLSFIGLLFVAALLSITLELYPVRVLAACAVACTFKYVGFQ